MHRHEVDTGRLRGLIRSFKRARVVVVGDIIVDHYIWGQVQRISPEAPVPVVEVREESWRLGGAANVANNIRRLGGAVELVGLAGRDGDGDRLAAELAGSGVGFGGLVRLPGRQTTVKTRIIAHGQQVVRVDREQKSHPTPKAVAAFKDFLEKSLSPRTIVVVSDYGKGMIGQTLLDFLREKSQRTRFKVLVDPKQRNFHFYRGFTMVTPNLHEAEMAANMDITDDESLKRAGRKLLEILESKALLVTRGEHGMSLFSDGRVENIETTAREVYDVTGAGDTVLAVLALALSVGASYLEAAMLANLAAGVVVGEVGTSTVRKEELLAALKSFSPHVES